MYTSHSKSNCSHTVLSCSICTPFLQHSSSSTKILHGMYICCQQENTSKTTESPLNFCQEQEPWFPLIGQQPHEGLSDVLDDWPEPRIPAGKRLDYMDGTPKIGGFPPKSSNFNRVFHYKPSIFGPILATVYQ